MPMLRGLRSRSWRSARWRSAVAVVGLAVSLGFVGTSASASVQWNPSSLHEVYAPTGGDFYAYAPSVIAWGNTTDIWDCENSVSGQVKDHVWFIQDRMGRQTQARSVLEGTGTGWDSFHNCDPSVIALDTTFNGQHYHYALFYTGNDLNASLHNEVGVAVAKSLNGPWVKYPDPLVPFTDTTLWGIGQPSAVTISKTAGTAVLFYTEGNATCTCAYQSVVNLHNLNAPVVKSPVLITTSGLTGTGGAPDWLNNYDVAYNAATNRFVIVREQHPYPTTNPDYIGSSLQIDSIPARDIWDGGGSWTVEGDINPALTGFPRNHNAGLVRTVTGRLPGSRSLTVVFTYSCDGSGTACPNSLFSYDLWSITGRI